MGFDISQWTRLESGKTPVWICPDKPDWFVPNSAGDRLLRDLAAGANGFDSIPERRFLQRLPDGPSGSYAGREGYLDRASLRELWFHVTNRCNQECTHCLFSSSPEAGDELATAKILETASRAYDLGCRIFALTGGEPFVHPGIGEVVEGLLRAGDTRVVLLTNGMLLRRFAGTIEGWPEGRFHLQVSADGLQAAHDRVRGDGAFHALTGELDWLRAREIPYTLSLCVTAGSVADLPGFVDFAAEHGAANVHLMWYFVRGRGDTAGWIDPDRIFPHLREAAVHAGRAGIGLDNLDAMRSQVFAPPGTKHDGTNAGWEAMAVGPDGRLYPSAALVKVPELGVEPDGDFRSAWHGHPLFERLLCATAAGGDAPLRFLTGGGDVDHAYIHDGRIEGGDPYLPLLEKVALWMIASEAEREPDDGPPALRLRMGEIQESCGSHGEVATTHGNCLLSLSGTDGHTAVKEFYAAAVTSPREDVDHFLNPAAYPEEVMAHVPAEARFRSFGCGSPILDAALRPGDSVVDLGSGTGLECFIASGMVGPSGNVCGVDMLDPMLRRAEAGAAGVAENLGYGNLEFRKGYLEDLPLEDRSRDVVLSNCVINLAAHKRRVFREIRRVLRPGGRLVISDVVSRDEPAASIRNDQVLRGECLGGAMTWKDLFGLLAETGFTRIRVHRRFPYRTVHDHPFESVTYEAIRPESGETAEWYGGELFTFLETGELQAENGEAAAGTCCCSPPEDAAASCCAPSPSGDGGVLMKIEGGAGAPHREGCMVCGAHLVYPDVPESHECSYCGASFLADGWCEAGHFVCDDCHGGNGRTIIERICLSTGETDMLALMAKIRSHRAMAIHGPEHHAMVPGIILATYRNLGGELDDDRIRAGIDRGAKVPGGYCGFVGACGAALGVGIAFGLILESNPVKAVPRRILQEVTSTVLARIAEREAGRCCQREAWIALREAVRLSERFLPLRLRADETLECAQAERNRECIGEACPIHP